MIGDRALRSASVLSDGNSFQKEKEMSQERGISRVVNVPPAAPGFVGPGHLAAPVVSPENFEMTDPFILLMDDRLDIGNRPVGGPHPHAGFETVTLILDGAIYDRDEGGTLNAGEVQWTTAGSGVRKRPIAPAVAHPTQK